MDTTRCRAMTSAMPLPVIVQCDFAMHPGNRHTSHVMTPMGEISVTWEARRRTEDDGLVQ